MGQPVRLYTGSTADLGKAAAVLEQCGADGLNPGRLGDWLAEVSEWAEDYPPPAGTVMHIRISWDPPSSD